MTKEKSISYVALSTGSVKFLCPKCGKVQIVRSPRERKEVVEYVCEECGFRGPN